jgi:hypothetical protein
MVAKKIGIGMLAVPIALTASSWGVLAGPPVDPTGSWRYVDSTGRGGSLMVITRNGIGEWSFVSHVAGPFASPLIERVSPFVGTTQRIGLDTFKYTGVSYLMQGDGTIIGVRVVSGTSRAVDANTAENTEWYAIYAPYQDPFGSDPPALGCYGPNVVRFVRIPVVPPCGS